MIFEIESKWDVDDRVQTLNKQSVTIKDIKMSYFVIYTGRGNIASGELRQSRAFPASALDLRVRMCYIRL